MNILAFDLGASGGKLFLARFADGRLSFEEVHRFDNAACAVGDSLYWDIFHIYNEMNRGIRKAVRLTNDRIDSFGVDSFANDFAFIDRNGAMLSPVHCYRDLRTQRSEAAIYGKISREKLYQLSGNQNALFNTFMQLASLREGGSGFLIDQAHRLLFVPDLLLYYLTGREVAEYTFASVSQLYDFRRDDWCDEILSAYQIPRSLFGTLVKPGTVIGQTTPAYNEQMGTRGFSVSAVCEHDTASAFLASPLLPDCALISCGTWCLIGTEIPSCLITREGYLANLANEGGPAGHHRLLRNVMGTWLLQETRRYYRENGQDYSFPELEELARQAKPFAFLFDPDGADFFSPGNMPRKIQKYCMRHYGKQPESVGEIVRSIYESLALKFRWVIEKLETVSGRQLPVINMIGGGAKAQLLCQYTADATGRDVFAGPTEASALGNISMQLIAMGAVSGIGEAKQITAATCQMAQYHPQKTQEWEQAYTRFLELL